MGSLPSNLIIIIISGIYPGRIKGAAIRATAALKRRLYSSTAPILGIGTNTLCRFGAVFNQAKGQQINHRYNNDITIYQSYQTGPKFGYCLLSLIIKYYIILWLIYLLYKGLFYGPIPSRAYLSRLRYITFMYLVAKTAGRNIFSARKPII